ncbi:MAG: hypothetical protein HC817_12630, partial [Saprospiraceae bacterium]|nr:hypothetical protein [Saprospiraceae bacterium]
MELTQFLELIKDKIMKKSIHYYAIITLTVPLVACNKEESLKDKNGVVISRPHIWAVTVTDDDTLAEKHFIRTTIDFNNSVLIGARKQGKTLLRMINLRDGKAMWEWSDFI